MTVEEHIKEKIREKFSPLHFELVNESHLHKGHVGDDGSGQTHFKLMVVSRIFEKQDRIERHRLVMDVLKGAVSMGLHALSLTALTPEEYKKK